MLPTDAVMMCGPPTLSPAVKRAPFAVETIVPPPATDQAIVGKVVIVVAN